MDDEPFVDFPYGFITGTDAGRAGEFWDRIQAQRDQPRPPRFGVVGQGYANVVVASGRDGAELARRVGLA